MTVHEVKPRLIMESQCTYVARVATYSKTNLFGAPSHTDRLPDRQAESDDLDALRTWCKATLGDQIGKFIIYETWIMTPENSPNLKRFWGQRDNFKLEEFKTW